MANSGRGAHHSFHATSGHRPPADGVRGVDTVGLAQLIEARHAASNEVLTQLCARLGALEQRLERRENATEMLCARLDALLGGRLALNGLSHEDGASSAQTDSPTESSSGAGLRPPPRRHHAKQRVSGRANSRPIRPPAHGHERRTTGAADAECDSAAAAHADACSAGRAVGPKPGERRDSLFLEAHAMCTSADDVSKSAPPPRERTVRTQAPAGTTARELAA
jgi:hypothetical protein